MAGKLNGKVSIITGAASGICRGTALIFAREGSQVVVADVDSKGGEETVGMIKSEGGDAIFLPTDVSQATQVQGMVQGTIDAFGKVDILVNGAGRQVVTPHLTEVTEEEWDLVLDINIKGVFLCMKEAIPVMLSGGGGAIVSISSATALKGNTFSVPYSVSKAGVTQITKVVHNQYCRQGIRANCVIPGLIDTPGASRVHGELGDFDDSVADIPVGRAGLPEDVGQLMLFLASDDASFIAGSCFVIDGGRETR